MSLTGKPMQAWAHQLAKSRGPLLSRRSCPSSTQSICTMAGHDITCLGASLTAFAAVILLHFDRSASRFGRPEHPATAADSSIPTASVRAPPCKGEQS